MIDRRAFLATAAGAMLPGVADAHHTSWRRFFRIPYLLPKTRIINVGPGRTIVEDGNPDELGLIVLPNAVWPGRVRCAGFGAYVCIGGHFDTLPDGRLYAPSGKAVNGVGDTFWLQCTGTPINGLRPFTYLARLESTNANGAVFGDIFRVGSNAEVSDWGAWPDVYSQWIKIAPRYGWGDYFGPTPEPPSAYGPYTSHTDAWKVDCGDLTHQRLVAACRHFFFGGIDLTWGFQGFFLPISWVDDKQEYRGPDGRALRQFWNTLATPALRSDLGTSKPPSLFYGLYSDERGYQGDYDGMRFHDAGEIADSKGVWIKPAPGIAANRNVFPVNQHFSPVFADNATSLVWSQTDWPENFPAYAGKIRVSSNPPVMVPASSVGIAHRVTSQEQLAAYVATLGWLN